MRHILRAKMTQQNIYSFVKERPQGLPKGRWSRRCWRGSLMCAPQLRHRQTRPWLPGVKEKSPSSGTDRLRINNRAHIMQTDFGSMQSGERRSNTQKIKDEITGKPLKMHALPSGTLRCTFDEHLPCASGLPSYCPNCIDGNSDTSAGIQ